MGEGEVVVEHDAPGAVEGELGAVLEGETPESGGGRGVGMQIRDGGIQIRDGGMKIQGGAEPADEAVGDAIGGGGRPFFEPGAQRRGVEPVEEEDRQESVKEAQGVGHEGGGIEVVLDEKGDGLGGNQERPEENEDAGPVAALPVMPEDEERKGASEAEQQRLETERGGERAVGEVEQSAEEIDGQKGAQGERGETNALGPGGCAGGE